MLEDLEPGRAVPKSELPRFQIDEASSIDETHRLLEEAVVGQNNSKGRLSVLLSLHLASVDGDGSLPPVPNAILIGPTGVGKTHSMRTLAADFTLPFVVIDATSLVPSGIVGFQVEDIMQLLYDEARRLLVAGGFRSQLADVIWLAERGVVVLDEFDKLAVRAEAAFEEHGRSQVQRRLLKMAEGSQIRVGVKQRTYGSTDDTYLDTSRLLVIGSGAFADLDERTAGKRKNSELYRELFGPSAIVAEDVRLYGFLPELVARFPLIIEFEPLQPRDLLEILSRSPDSPLRIWERFADIRGFQLSVENRALALLSTRAAKLGLGARALQQLLFPYLSQRFLEAARRGEQEVIVRGEDLQISGELYSAPVSSDTDTMTTSQDDSNEQSA